MEINDISNTILNFKVISPEAEDTSGGVSFAKHLFDELNNVNEKIVTAENNIKQLAIDKNANLHEVLLSIKSAKTSLEMIMNIRNKALEGLHEVLRMQV